MGWCLSGRMGGRLVSSVSYFDGLFSFSLEKKRSKRNGPSLGFGPAKRFAQPAAPPSVGLCYSHRRAIHFMGLFNDVE